MNAPRKKNVVALPDSPELGGIGGAIKKHANTALTVLLLVAAVVMFVRWRMGEAAKAKQLIAIELNSARTKVQELGPTKFVRYLYHGPGDPLPPSDVLKTITSFQNDANTAITNVLNNSDATTSMRAEALMLRGDLYWELANLPPLPGSSTQPSLQLTETSDALLQKASDAYQEVIKNSTYAEQHEQLAGCHLGLAAIAENRGDYKTAEAELNLVKNDTNTLAVLQKQAEIQLLELPEIQKKMYLAPPTGIGPVAGPTPTPPTGQIGPPAPVMTPTTQVTLPSMLTNPVVPVAPTTKPAFKP